MDREEIEARLAITDVLHRYARAMDRMDAPLALSCWHPGGTDDHAPLYSGTAAGFIEWLWPVHATLELTRHSISNVLIEVDGSRAATECYWQVTLRKKFGEDIWDSISQGRYIDRFERIDGSWAINHRQSLMDWNRTEKVLHRRGDPGVPIIVEPNNPEVQPPPNRRDHGDYSYSALTHRSPGRVSVG
ncbi:nuclear transport factor 2 family protein [Sandaracinobacter sp. RS1-74]|uniref:nuclear transport factor 2 family protein n=1 Tax=Sandaracinobacteroides sayramensis TaxID=2913411 RepID=UPI001EDB5273|nr:nuclear transport factor 2 family protein [Sandaracinobacteroides sayramensis]MCG2840558.1 nuclear transport factor 2 family protein [Sandaracinobacteroides sayramensis]